MSEKKTDSKGWQQISKAILHFYIFFFQISNLLYKTQKKNFRICLQVYNCPNTLAEMVLNFHFFFEKQIPVYNYQFKKITLENSIFDKTKKKNI